MCAARVEILSDKVLVKDKVRDQIMGKGKGVYDLRNPDLDMDVFAKPTDPSGSTPAVLLELGRDVGTAIIATDKDCTTIDEYRLYTWAGKQETATHSHGSRPYKGQKPEPASITDREGNVLARVTHQSSK